MFNGELPFIVKLPRVSSNREEGERPFQSIDAERPCCGNIDDVPGDSSLELLEYNDELDCGI